MGNTLDWPALDGLIEYFSLAGAEIELVIASLIEIKDMVDQLRRAR